ncbi:MAG: substrate-binding domain-containing protein [Verrucomicrobiota bacterium]
MPRNAPAPAPIDEAPPNPSPDEALLKGIALSPRRDLPLHAQLRRALLEIITEHCEEGQKFYTEPLLIERLGVSQSTVRRALTDLTREGYLIRRVAKGSYVHLPTPRQTELTLHVFLPGWNYNSFLMGMLEAFSTRSRECGHTIRIHYTHKNDDPSRALQQVDQPGEECGIVLLCNDARTTNTLYWAFHNTGHRVVNVDTLMPNYPGHFVGTSNVGIVTTGLRHLAELGHQRIVFLINEAEQANILERTVCFRREAEALGLDEARVVQGKFRESLDNFRASYDCMDELMDGPDAPTAIMSFSDPGAWGALKWLAEHNVKVPEECSVIGFNDDRPSTYVFPALTTLAHPVKKLAATALEMIVNPSENERSVILPPTFIERETTAPPPAG